MDRFSSLNLQVKFGGDAGIKIGKAGGGGRAESRSLLFSVVESGAIVDLSIEGALPTETCTTF